MSFWLPDRGQTYQIAKHIHPRGTPVQLHGVVVVPVPQHPGTDCLSLLHCYKCVHQMVLLRVTCKARTTQVTTYKWLSQSQASNKHYDHQSTGPRHEQTKLAGMS